MKPSEALQRANAARAAEREREQASEVTLVAKDGCRITVFVEVRSAICGHGKAMRKEASDGR